MYIITLFLWNLIFLSKEFIIFIFWLSALTLRLFTQLIINFIEFILHIYDFLVHNSSLLIEFSDILFYDFWYLR